MKPSLVGVIYDLLRFYGQGNFTKFDRCFTKACQYLDIKLKEEDRKRFRNYAFHFLRSTGYIEFGSIESENHWSVSPEAFVQLTENDFVVIGGSSLIRTLWTMVDSASRKEIPISSGGVELPDGLFFYPSQLKISANLTYLRQLSTMTKVPIITLYQSRFFDLLPSLSSIHFETLEPIRSTDLFETENADQYDFRLGKWEPFKGMFPNSAGLYRRSFQYAPSDFFIAVQKNSFELTMYEVKQQEWVLICALSLLKIRLPLIFNETSSSISVSRKYRGLRIPMLLERCLRSGSLVPPTISGDWTTYTNILPKSFWSLVARIPIFEVKTR